MNYLRYKRATIAVLLSFVTLPAFAGPYQSEMSQYSKETKQSLKAYRKAFSEIKTVENWAVVYRMAHKQGDTFAVPFFKKHHEFVDGKLKEQPKFDSLMAFFPGFSLGYAAEGTALVFNILYTDFEKLARKTRSPLDDGLIKIMISAYGDHASYFGNWFAQTWDYGGCSHLGKGIHTSLLTEIDQELQKSDIFKPELTALKEKILKDILTGNYYCNPEAQIQTEIKAVLLKVKLSLEEKAKIKARAQALKPPKIEMNCFKQSCSYG